MAKPPLRDQASHPYHGLALLSQQRLAGGRPSQSRGQMRFREQGLSTLPGHAHPYRPHSPACAFTLPAPCSDLAILPAEQRRSKPGAPRASGPLRCERGVSSAQLSLPCFSQRLQEPRRGSHWLCGRLPLRDPLTAASPAIWGHGAGVQMLCATIPHAAARVSSFQRALEREGQKRMWPGSGFVVLPQPNPEGSLNQGHWPQPGPPPLMPTPVLSGGGCGQGGPVQGRQGGTHHTDELHLRPPILLSAFPLLVTFPHLQGYMGPDTPHTAFLQRCEGQSSGEGTSRGQLTGNCPPEQG